MDLVGQRNEQGLLIDRIQMVDVARLPGVPVLFLARSPSPTLWLSALACSALNSRMCARTASSIKRDKSPFLPPPWLARNMRNVWSVSADTARFQRTEFMVCSFKGWSMHRRIDVCMPKKRHITSEADSQTRETRRHWVNAKKHHPDWPEVFSHRNHRTDQPDPALHNHQPSTTQQDSSHGKNAASAACGTEIVSRAHYRLPKFRCKPDITGWHLSLSFLGVSAKRRIFNLNFEVAAFMLPIRGRQPAGAGGCRCPHRREAAGRRCGRSE